MNINIQDFPFYTHNFSLITDEFGGKWLVAQELSTAFSAWPQYTQPMQILNSQEHVVAAVMLPHAYEFSALLNDEQKEQFAQLVGTLYSYLRNN